eukprot:NODE_541_length_6897_cov_0.247426.p2 type:complete len:333 gc:universal NODE_541_length_6897_cov_0.247426:4331-3333(-)
MTSQDHFLANMRVLNERLNEVEILNSKCCSDPNERDIQRLRGLIHRTLQIIDFDMQFRQEDGKGSDELIKFSQDPKRLASPISSISKKKKVSKDVITGTLNALPIKKKELITAPKIMESAQSEAESMDIDDNGLTRQTTDHHTEIGVEPIPDNIEELILSPRKTRIATRASTPPEINIPDSVNIRIGELVAVKTDDWILGYITKIIQDPSKNINKTKYSVSDYEDKSITIQNKLRRHIMRLPAEAAVVGDVTRLSPMKQKLNWPEFSPDSKVYALFPETTSLYSGAVILPPSMYKLNLYKIKFDDDEQQFRDIDARFVTSPELRKMKLNKQF